MVKNISFASILLFTASLIITGCTSTHSLSQGRSFKLKQVSFSELNGWKEDNLKEVVYDYFDLNRDYSKMEDELIKKDNKLKKYLLSGRRILNEKIFA